MLITSKNYQFIIIAIFSVMLFGCNRYSDEQIQVLSGSTMGTSFNIQIVINSKNINKELIASEINAIFELINSLMSTWRKDSELSRINQAAINQWVTVSADTLNVIELAYSISELSNGAFDITIGNIINLWGFGPNGRPSRVPNKVSIQQAISTSGFRQLDIDHEQSAIKKNVDMYIDLSAIAKGYAVDKIAFYLDKNSFSGYLIEVGGEIRIKGKKPDNTIWKVAIEIPEVQPIPESVVPSLTTDIKSEFRKVKQVISLTNQSIATSGDYRNYFEQNGKRYSHTLNPVTGKPITHSLASVTVISENAAKADAIATALMVMGIESGLKFSEKNNIAAYFIYRGNNNFKVATTNEFKQYLVINNLHLPRLQ